MVVSLSGGYALTSGVAARPATGDEGRAVAQVPPLAAPLACQSGTNKSGDADTGFSTGQITFCPNVSTVKVCDYFTTQNGGCPGETALASTTIQFTCVSGCTGTYTFTSGPDGTPGGCPTLAGVTPGTQIVIDYNVIGGVPPNPNGNHGEKNYVEFRNTANNTVIGHACGPSFNENASPTPTRTPAPIPPTLTPTPGNNGCSPGFWKNHPKLYPSPYTPNTTLGSVFDLPTCSGISGLAGDTFDEALSYNGGPTVLDAAKLLLRQAVAAVLNAAAGIGYPLTVQQVIDEVNTALASCDRATILAEKDRLDRFNNLGCPLPGATRTPTRTNTPVPPTRTFTVVPPTRTNTPVPPTRTFTVVPPTRTSTPVPPTRTFTVVPPTRTSTPVPPTRTFTVVPPTRTPTRTPTCVPPTAVPIVTPAFTPAPGCSETLAADVLTAVITDHPNTTSALFMNTSNTCSYRIGLAVYRAFSTQISSQLLYDYELAVIPPHSSLTLEVNNPPCRYQGDAFYGPLIVSFASGDRYGGRLLDDTLGKPYNFCPKPCS
jgi:hypothetical protein